jgi:hypothetical protein
MRYIPFGCASSRHFVVETLVVSRSSFRQLSFIVKITKFPIFTAWKKPNSNDSTNS